MTVFCPRCGDEVEVEVSPEAVNHYATSITVKWRESRVEHVCQPKPAPAPTQEPQDKVVLYVDDYPVLPPVLPPEPRRRTPLSVILPLATTWLTGVGHGLRNVWRASGDWGQFMATWLLLMGVIVGGLAGVTWLWQWAVG